MGSRLVRMAEPKGLDGRVVSSLSQYAHLPLALPGGDDAVLR